MFFLLHAFRYSLILIFNCLSFQILKGFINTALRVWKLLVFLFLRKNFLFIIALKHQLTIIIIAVNAELIQAKAVAKKTLNKSVGKNFISN